MTVASKSKSTRALTKSSASSESIKGKKAEVKPRAAKAAAKPAAKAFAHAPSKMIQREIATGYAKGNDLVLLPGEKLTYLSPRSK